MPDTPVANVHNGFLPSNLPDAMTSTPSPCGSASTAPSKGSSGSHITLVEHHHNLTCYQNTKFDDAYKVPIYKPHKHTWVDRLLGIFCVKVPRKKQTIMHRRSVQPRPESYGGSSPWILPVYVLSTRQDKDMHHVAMEAKCTIDTGNMQGNIVSRKFVEEVLEYPESAICALTKEEEAGATGITGHQLIPQGAIYLTWYHKKSTRVFRNMRFLISPNQHCDLIIGAQSIQKHRLLDVPNLMAQANADRIVLNSDDSEDETEADLSNKVWKIDSRLKDLKTLIEDAEKDDEEEDAKKYREELVELQKELPIVKLRHEISKVKIDESLSEAQKEAHLKVLEAQLEKTAGDGKAKLIPKTGLPRSTAIEEKGSGLYRANQGKARTK